MLEDNLTGALKMKLLNSEEMFSVCDATPPVRWKLTGKMTGRTVCHLRRCERAACWRTQTLFRCLTLAVSDAVLV